MKPRYVAWLGLALWVAAIALLMPLAGKKTDAGSANADLALPQHAEVTRALARERAAFPDADTLVAVVVYVRDSGITAADPGRSGRSPRSCWLPWCSTCSG